MIRQPHVRIRPYGHHGSGAWCVDRFDAAGRWQMTWAYATKRLARAHAARIRRIIRETWPALRALTVTA